jgi:hypothetical protein
MSDFGAVWEYAMMLEAEMPPATLMKFDDVRPAAMGPSKKEREELAKKAQQPATPAPAPAHAAADDRRK